VKEVLWMTRIYVAARLRWDELKRLARRDRGGITTEAAIWTALLAGAAIVIAGIIIAKITERANSIDLGTTPGG
jgi:hypothetical protein